MACTQSTSIQERKKQSDERAIYTQAHMFAVVTTAEAYLGQESLP